MDQSVKDKKAEKPPVELKTCTCRLRGHGVDMHITDIEMPKERPAMQFAKKAYSYASSSLKRLQLGNYKIVVIEPNGHESAFDLAGFK